MSLFWEYGEVLLWLVGRREEMERIGLFCSIQSTTDMSQIHKWTANTHLVSKPNGLDDHLYNDGQPQHHNQFPQQDGYGRMSLCQCDKWSNSVGSHVHCVTSPQAKLNFSGKENKFQADDRWTTILNIATTIKAQQSLGYIVPPIPRDLLSA